MQIFSRDLLDILDKSRMLSRCVGLSRVAPDSRGETSYLPYVAEVMRLLPSGGRWEKTCVAT